MLSKLHAAVSSIVNEAFDDALRGPNKAVNDGVDHFEGYSGTDLKAKCDYCNAPLWLVWEDGVPAKRWTECGGIGEGSCDTRAGHTNESVEWWERDDEMAWKDHSGDCIVCGKESADLNELGVCQGNKLSCERMMVRTKAMDPSLDDMEAIAFLRSLRKKK